MFVPCSMLEVPAMEENETLSCYVVISFAWPHPSIQALID